MRFVRSLSDALKFRPWLRFWSLVCISSGCGRFVALWGLWSFVRWFFGFSVALVPFRSSAAFPPCLAPYFVRYGLLFCFVGSSSPVVLFSFCGLFTASDFWQRFRFWAWLWCMFSAVFARCRFGYNLPVVFSASFWDPVRLLLFSWFYIPGAGRRSRLPFSASGVVL